MNKLEHIIKSKEYQNLLFKHFSDIGFELIYDEQQKIKFKKDFIEYNIDINDGDNLSLYNILMNTYWFGKFEDDNLFGLYFHPEIKEYTCIIQFDNEWSIRYRGNDAQNWIQSFLRRKEGRNIPQKLSNFLIDTSFLNKDIILYPEINEEDIFNLYKIKP